MDISLSEPAVPSPCVDVCELDENNICSGCFRSLDEIAGWGYADNEDRRKIVASAMQRKLTVGND